MSVWIRRVTSRTLRIRLVSSLSYCTVFIVIQPTVNKLNQLSRLHLPRIHSKLPALRGWVTLIAFTVIVCIANARGAAQDWPQWRGVDRDAKIEDVGLRTNLPTGQLPRSWSVPIGSGYSGPTIADGRVFVTDRGPDGPDSSIERVLCFDAASGKQLWVHSYESSYEIQYVAGPRASVTIADGLAYAVGAMGHFHCLDAATGDVIWSRDLNQEYKIRMPAWGITASPMSYRGTVIQVTGGTGNACLVAFDAKTGKERWRSIDEKAGYSAPVLIQQAGRDVIVAWTGESLSGVGADDGRVLWRVDMKPRNMPIGVATPVISGDLIFVSSFYDGSLLVKLDRESTTAETVWRRVGQDEKNTDALHCMISNPLIKGDYIYGADSHGEFRCLDLQTGDRVWESLDVVPRARWATVHTIQAGDREIMQNDQGELIFASLNPQGYTEIARTKLLDRTKAQLNRRGGVTWSHPAIANGFIYARNDKELICASLKPIDTQ